MWTGAATQVLQMIKYFRWKATCLDWLMSGKKKQCLWALISSSSFYLEDIMTV